MSREIPIVVRTENGGWRLPAILTPVLLLAVAFLALVAWSWLNGHVFNLGVNDGETVLVNRAQLLEKVRAFEVATIKHTYKTNASVEATKDFNAGVFEVGLPSWLAGQKMQVNGEVTVTAGADLSRLREEDIFVTQRNGRTEVTILLPAPQILSTEVVPRSLDIETSQGILTRARTRMGLSESDLKDGALDRLVTTAKDGALKYGLLSEAETETQARLTAFLNTLSGAANSNVTYVVRTVAPRV